MAWATQMSFSTWLIIMVASAVVMTALVSATLPRGLSKTFAATTPTVRYTEDQQANTEYRYLLRKLMALSSLTALTSLASFVLLLKYHLVYAGVLASAVAVIPSIWTIKTSRRLSEISRSRKKPVTASEPGIQEVEHKTRFYLFFTLLTVFSMLAGFLFWACVYLLVFGERTTPVISLLCFGLLCIAIVPLASGLVVRKLGLPAEIET